MSVKSRPQSTHKHTMEKTLLTGKRQVYDFVGYSFECIGFRHELCKLGFIGF
jgi:hypothetical protein